MCLGRCSAGVHSVPFLFSTLSASLDRKPPTKRGVQYKNGTIVRTTGAHQFNEAAKTHAIASKMSWWYAMLLK